jgi:hypothetical protein
MNVTLPVGRPPACAVTLAVRVIEAPAGEGFSDDVSDVVVAAGVAVSEIVSVRVGAWLPAFRGSPP